MLVEDLVAANTAVVMIWPGRTEGGAGRPSPRSIVIPDACAHSPRHHQSVRSREQTQVNMGTRSWYNPSRMEPNHTWSLRVHSDDPGVATVHVRRHRFDVGVPLQFDEEYAEVTALEYALGAIASDVVVGLRRLARKRRIAMDRVEALVHGEVDNPLTFLPVVGEDGHPGLTKVRLKVFVSSMDAPERVQEAWEETLRTSPLVRTFQASVDLDLIHEVVI